MERGTNLPDLERSLVKKGEKEAKAMARHLAERYPVPDLMISSFANRAIETAHVVAKAMGYPAQKILLRDSFYENTAVDSLADEIRRQPDNYRSLLLVGHDPAFSRLAAHFIKGFRETIPKAGVVIADFSIERWADLKARSGRLLEFTSPGRLKEERKHARSDLETQLAQNLNEILSRINKRAADALKDEIHKSARKIAKEFLKARGEGTRAHLDVRPRPAR